MSIAPNKDTITDFEKRNWKKMYEIDMRVFFPPGKPLFFQLQFLEGSLFHVLPPDSDAFKCVRDTRRIGLVTRLNGVSPNSGDTKM